MFPRLCATLIFPLFGSDCLGQSGPSGCLSYEPVEVTLHGSLARRTYPGSPNYEDSGKGDHPETYWLLILDSPIFLDESKSDPELNPKNENIREVQLVVTRGMYENSKSLVGQRVVARGTLFGEHTAHHHTPVLLTVKTLELDQKK